MTIQVILLLSISWFSCPIREQYLSAALLIEFYKVLQGLAMLVETSYFKTCYELQYSSADLRCHGDMFSHYRHSQKYVYQYTCHASSTFILTLYRGRRDQAGGSLRSRPLHCTLLGLKPAISPNVGKSGAQFLVEGVCVRAAPDKNNDNWTFIIVHDGCLQE